MTSKCKKIKNTEKKKKQGKISRKTNGRKRENFMKTKTERDKKRL